MQIRSFLLLGLLVGCATDDYDGPAECRGVDFMTDADHCGECSLSCGGGTCNAGVCTAATLVTGQDKPNGIAIDGNRMVWTTEGALTGDPSGTIATCPIDGCGAAGPKVLYNGLGRPRNPIIVGDKIYFVDGLLGTVGGDITGFVPEVGTFTGTALANLMWWGSKRDVTSLAVSNNQIYFGTLEQYEGAKDAFTAMCPASGCPTNGTEVYLLADARKSISSVLVDATYLYFVEFGSAEIGKANRTTGAAQSLFTGELGALFLAQDETTLYWGTSVPQQQGLTIKNYLASGSKNGGTKTKLAEVGEVTSIAVAGDWLYFTDGTGLVGRIAKAGGSVETLASGQKHPQAIAVAGEFVYWANRDAFTISKLRL